MISARNKTPCINTNKDWQTSFEQYFILLIPCVFSSIPGKKNNMELPSSCTKQHVCIFSGVLPTLGWSQVHFVEEASTIMQATQGQQLEKNLHRSQWWEFSTHQLRSFCIYMYLSWIQRYGRVIHTHTDIIFASFRG